MCADGHFYEDDPREMEKVNGECVECGTPTIDGEAASGCNHSPESCEVCGHTPCDQYC